MPKKSPWILSMLLAMTAFAVTAFAGDDDVEIRIVEDVEIHTEKDEDGRRVMVFVGDDGKKVEIEGDASTWVAHHGGHGGHGKHFFGHGHHGGGFLGVGLSELTPELRLHFGVPEDAGVMISKVYEDSPASRAGIEVGDIITAVDGDAVDSGRDLARMIRGREDGEAATLELWRDGRVENLTAMIEEREAPGRSWSFSGSDLELDCGGDDCEVRIECDGGDCDCSVNGESLDCKEMHRFHHGDE